MEEDETSDVEIDGMDLNDDEEDGNVEYDTSAVGNDTVDSSSKVEEDEEQISARGLEEAQEMEEARQERLELMAAEQKKAAQWQKEPVTQQEKLQYLLGQSEVFAHFLAGTFCYRAFLVTITVNSKWANVYTKYWHRWAYNLLFIYNPVAFSFFFSKPILS